MKQRALLGLCLLAGLVATGCDDAEPSAADAGATADAGPVASADPTWHQDIKPLVNEHCNGCHHEGGAGPFEFESYAGTKAMAAAAMDAIEHERMPPWQASRDCRPIEGERYLPPAGRDLFAQWIGAGMPEGQPVAESAQIRDLPPPDLVGTAGTTYMPSDERPDDYRCLILDLDFDTDTYIVGTNVAPDQVPIVHHVLVYVIPPNEVAEMQQIDADEPGPGYTCYGTPRTSGVPSPIAAWVPGMGPQMLPDDSMYFLPAGSKLVMQMHYNVLSTPPAADQTALHLYTADVPRASVLESLPQVQLNLTIPAGDPAVEITKLLPYRNATPGVAVGAAPHMHILGTAIKVQLMRANGDTECVIDLPKWDFNWQQNYRFVEPLEVQQGDTFKLTCMYDNSAENQPVVNGTQLTPRDVHWGDGTLDEMCLNFIMYKRPFTAASGVQCGGFTDCRSQCEDTNSFACVMGCGAQDLDCGLCMIFDMLGDGGCAREQCLNQVLGGRECLQGCMGETVAGGSDLISCMAATCPTELDAISACMDPLLAAGACEPSVDACLPQ